MTSEEWIAYRWGPFVVARAEDTGQLTALFTETQPDGSTTMRTATLLERERLLDHVFNGCEENEGGEQILEVINSLRSQLGQE